MNDRVVKSRVTSLKEEYSINFTIISTTSSNFTVAAFTVAVFTVAYLRLRIYFD